MGQRRILIVEDEAVTSVMLEKTLKELGYEVVGSAFDGKEALNIAKDKHPDLVLMDIRLQGDMDGIETAKKIYKQYNIPSIYLTAHSDEDTIRRAVESGPFGYLIKPFKERELYSNIEMVAHKHKLYRTTAAPPKESEEPDKEEKPQVISQPPQPDLRLGILAVQVLPHPVVLLNPAGTIVYYNPSFKNFNRASTGNSDSLAASIDEMPEICRKIWNAGKSRFREGKGFSITGPIQLKGVNRRYKVDMIPVIDKGVLHFIVVIILPGESAATDQIATDGVIDNLLEETVSAIKEIRFLASPEETYRLHQIIIRSDTALRNLSELKQISYPAQNGKKTGQMLTG